MYDDITSAEYAKILNYIINIYKLFIDLIANVLKITFICYIILLTINIVLCLKFWLIYSHHY